MAINTTGAPALPCCGLRRKPASLSLQHSHEWKANSLDKLSSWKDPRGPPAPSWDRDGASLSKKDALLEVVMAQGCLLQTLKGEAQVEVESSPHLTQLSLGQCPWKTTALGTQLPPLAMGLSGPPSLYPISY